VIGKRHGRETAFHRPRYDFGWSESSVRSGAVSMQINKSHKTIPLEKAFHQSKKQKTVRMKPVATRALVTLALIHHLVQSGSL
jgi:hypothetical protein